MSTHEWYIGAPPNLVSNAFLSKQNTRNSTERPANKALSFVNNWYFLLSDEEKARFREEDDMLVIQRRGIDVNNIMSWILSVIQGREHSSPLADYSLKRNISDVSNIRLVFQKDFIRVGDYLTLLNNLSTLRRGDISRLNYDCWLETLKLLLIKMNKQDEKNQMRIDEQNQEISFVDTINKLLDSSLQRYTHFEDAVELILQNYHYIKSETMQTALRSSVQLNLPMTTRLILNDPFKRLSKIDTSILKDAVSQGRIECVRVLIDRTLKHYVDITQRMKKELIEVATKRKHKDIVDLLSTYRVDRSRARIHPYAHRMSMVEN